MCSCVFDDTGKTTREGEVVAVEGRLERALKTGAGTDRTDLIGRVVGHSFVLVAECGRSELSPQRRHPGAVPNARQVTFLHRGHTAVLQRAASRNRTVRPDDHGVPGQQTRLAMKRRHRPGTRACLHPSTVRDGRGLWVILLHRHESPDVFDHAIEAGRADPHHPRVVVAIGDGGELQPARYCRSASSHLTAVSSSSKTLTVKPRLIATVSKNRMRSRFSEWSRMADRMSRLAFGWLGSP